MNVSLGDDIARCTNRVGVRITPTMKRETSRTTSQELRPTMRERTWPVTVAAPMAVLAVLAAPAALVLLVVQANPAAALAATEARAEAASQQAVAKTERDAPWVRADGVTTVLVELPGPAQAWVLPARPTTSAEVRAAPFVPRPFPQGRSRAPSLRQVAAPKARADLEPQCLASAHMR
jgi:hypothetical protein